MTTFSNFLLDSFFDAGRENLIYVRELPASFEGRVNRIAHPNMIQLFSIWRSCFTPDIRFRNHYGCGNKNTILQNPI